MATAGIDSPAALARRMKVNRQTVHRWIAGEGDKLTPDMLFRLAEALEVNPQWLALGTPHSPVKPHIPSPEQAELIALYESLPPAARDTWVSSGRDLIKLLTPSSANNPFATNRKK